ncbi:MarR family transcriptional regulator [Pseudoalteromonas piscicida]|uniref:MarR family transcriptional regulator n=1 Tax=Pseudoalteromonas piscicida TaxID=43662 RepID=UPI00273966DF|nr:MarR family transcriptional regulator [Pseudoalteromonas piscicida]MDP4487595.1 MarR family transcriptional regulator [Pseudoalteromonas piscicida]
MSSLPFHETLDLSLCGKLGRVHRICRQAVTQAVEPLGFTQPRWTAMMHIHHLGEGCTQHQLACSLDIEMPSLTRTMKQLEENNVIERLIDKQDKRCRKIYFTEHGQAQLAQLKMRISEVKALLYHELSDDELNAIAHALVKLENNAQQCCDNISENGSTSE